MYFYSNVLHLSDFQRLPQSSRVSQSLNGDLYFSNVLREDSRNDYICYARFPHTQTIQQKQPITVKVINRKSASVREEQKKSPAMNPDECDIVFVNLCLRMRGRSFSVLCASMTACRRETAFPISDLLSPSSETPVVVVPLKRHIVRALVAPCPVCQAAVHFLTSVRHSVLAASKNNNAPIYSHICS